MATTIAFDFKGHPTSKPLQPVTSKTTQPDWSALLGQRTIAAMATPAASLLDSETFSASSERDAIGRVLTAISPDSSEVLYTYDEGGGLQKVELEHRGSRSLSCGDPMPPDSRGQLKKGSNSEGYSIMVINRIQARLTCPRCGFTSETDVEGCIDGFGPINRYRIGDIVDWNPSITQEYQGRPPLGDHRIEGYAECPICKKDYFVVIVIERDKITRVTPIRDKPGYIP